MTKTIGYKTTLHVFRSQQKYKSEKSRLAHKGQITDVFVNNRHAFELRRWRLVN
jgi:hypothetical protein